MPYRVLAILLLLCSLGGCGGRQVVEVEDLPAPTVASPEESKPTRIFSKNELAQLQELASRNVVRPDEASQISARLLQEEIAPVLDEQTLNNLEKVLLTALAQSDKQNQAVIQRDLGITYFYNKKYHKARQTLQSANESNPRDARTHYYLACLFQQKAKVEEAKGDKVAAERFRKRAQIEIETAQKLAPNNQTYRKNLLEPNKQR